MTTMTTGGCVCGAIRYATQTEPEFSLICQCRDCQRISGGGHAASFAVLTDATTVSGALVYYETVADNGNTVSSGFCGNCGNPVLKKPAGYPQYLFIHAATLDVPDSFIPQMVVYSKSGQPWDHVDPSLPRR